MSDFFIKLIPMDPQYIPNVQDAQEARRHLIDFFTDSKGVNLHFLPKVEFVDPGANFEAILCPFCKRQIDISWWQEAMDQAARQDFIDLEINTPCCGHRSSLNDLIYNWPAGFAKFILSILNADHDIGNQELEEIERILGCRLKKIKAHY